MVDAHALQQRGGLARRRRTRRPSACRGRGRCRRPRWITSWSVGCRSRVADELAVDLEVVERQVLEVVEGAEAGAEVVEREAAAEVGEALGERARAARCSRPRAVSVISKMRSPGSTRVRAQLASISSGSSGVGQRAAGQVDLQAQGAAGCAAISSIARCARPSGRCSRSGRSARPSGGTASGGIRSPSVLRHADQQLVRWTRRLARSRIGCAWSTNRSSLERVADPARPGQPRPRRAEAAVGEYERVAVAARLLGRVHREVRR